MADFIQMQTFVLVSELKSITATACQLRISSAAVSKQLTRLEEELGLQLMVRSTRKIELTEVGRNYYLQCKRILEEVAAASELISQIKMIPSGTLRVVSGRHFAKSYIVPHIKEFLIKYPKIELSLELAERIPDLNTEAIDVIIGMSISASDNAIQKKIGTTFYSFCASSAYLMKHGVPKKPKDLQNHKYITHSMRNPDNELEFNNKEIVVLKPYLKVNDAETMLNFALDGLGIVKLHHYVVKKHLEQGLLEEILGPYNTQEIPIYVAYPQRRFISSQVRCFIDFIVEKMNQ